MRCWAAFGILIGSFTAVGASAQTKAVLPQGAAPAKATSTTTQSLLQKRRALSPVKTQAGTPTTAQAEVRASRDRLRLLERIIKADPKSLTNEELLIVEKAITDRFNSIQIERSRRDGPEKPLTPEEIYKKCSGSVTSVVATSPSGVATGTGFFHSVGCVLTNFHVAAEATAIRVTLADGSVAKVQSIEWADRAADLALLRLDGTYADANGDPTHPIAEEEFMLTEPAVGSPVYVIGDPRGLQKTFTNGLVSAVRQGEGFTKALQISVPISPGSSGSPVFNQFGRVVGVVTSTVLNGQNLNFCTLSDYVRPGLIRSPMSLEQWASFSKPIETLGMLPRPDLQLFARLLSTEGGSEAIPLRSLKSLGILVEELPEELFGVITRHQVFGATQKAVAERLPSSRTYDAMKPTPEGYSTDYIYVRLNAIQLSPDSLVVDWSLQVARRYCLARDPERQGDGTNKYPVIDTWVDTAKVLEKGGLLAGSPESMSARIQAAIKKAVDEIGRYADLVTSK